MTCVILLLENLPFFAMHYWYGGFGSVRHKLGLVVVLGVLVMYKLPVASFWERAQVVCG